MRDMTQSNAMRDWEATKTKRKKEGRAREQLPLHGGHPSGLDQGARRHGGDAALDDRGPEQKRQQKRGSVFRNGAELGEGDENPRENAPADEAASGFRGPRHVVSPGSPVITNAFPCSSIDRMRRMLGSRDRRRKPRKVERAPNRIVRAKAMMMKGGIDTMGFPPTIRGQLKVERMVKANPPTVPDAAPARAKTWTWEGMRGRISSTSATEKGGLTRMLP